MDAKTLEQQVKKISGSVKDDEKGRPYADHFLDWQTVATDLTAWIVTTINIAGADFACRP